MDLSGGRMLAQEARRRRAMGGDLYVFNLKEQGREELRQSGVQAQLGVDHFFPMGSDPLGAIVPRLDPAICAGCTRRIFHCCPPKREGPAL